MDVRVELLAYNVWAADDDKTGFLSVGVDISNRLYLIEGTISFPMVPMSTINRKYEKWGQLRKLNKSKCEIFFMNDQNIMFGYTPLKKLEK